MSRRSIPFSLIGLTLGVLLGIGIVYVKSFILDELIGILDHEVKGSCDCTLEYDTRALSFLRLRAEVKNIRIVERGIPKLQFKELSSRFGFSGIRNKKLYLDLVLDSGFSAGVGPSSATYRFLDFLTMPTEKSKDPNRWQVKVRTLKLQNSTLYEKVSAAYTLEAHGTSMFMERDANNEFNLSPSIEELRLVPSPDKSGETPIPITVGGFKSSFHLGDSSIRVFEARLSQALSYFTMVGTALHSEPNTPLAFDTNLKLDLPSYISSIQSGAIVATGNLSGNVTSPRADGAISLESPLQTDSTDPLLTKLQGSYRLRKDNSGKISFIIPQLSAQGPQTDLSLTKSISIGNTLSGGLALNMRRLSVGGTTLNNVSIGTTLGGEIDSPEVHYSATCDTIGFDGIPLTLPKLSAEGLITSNSITATVSTPEERVLNATIGLGSKTLTKVNFSAQKFPLSPNYALSGTGNGEGILANNSFSFLGKLSLLTRDLVPVVQSELKITPRELLLTSIATDRTLKARLRTVFGKESSTELSAQLTNFSGFHDKNSGACFGLDGSLEVTLADKDTGVLHLSGARLGCGESKLSLNQPAVLSMKEGIASIPGVTLSGSAGKLSIAGIFGTTKDSHITITGNSDLSPFSSLIPSVDGISGGVKADITITGPRDQLNYSGGLIIKDAGFTSESLGLTAENINGTFSLEQGGIISVTGRVNGGHLLLDGSLRNPKTPLKASLKSVILSPTPESSLETSAELTLSSLDQNSIPTLSGTFTVENGLYAKNIDLAAIIQDIIWAFSSRHTTTTNVPGSTQPLNLDLQMSVPGNLFVSTNIGEAELVGSLKVTGPSSSPEIQGSLETLSGSFLIKENRFEIISSTLTFSPLNSQPYIALLASTSARSPNGELVQVMIDAQGPLNNPKVVFSSDRPMTEQELLTIIAFGERTVDRTGSMPLNQSRIEFVKADRDSDSLLAALFSRLTRIDALNFEPQYNIRTGLIEPRVLVRKDITSHLALIGESNLGGTDTYRRLKLLYGMTPNTNVLTYAEETGARANSAIGADIVWSILKDDFINSKLTIEGLPHDIRRQELLQAMKLYENYRVASATLNHLETLGETFLNQHGYLDAKVSVRCDRTPQKTNCSQVYITIKANEHARIARVSFKGDRIPEQLGIDTDMLIDKEASLEHAQDFAQRLVRALREKEYYSARVTPEITLLPHQPGSAEITYQVTLGRKIAFTFTGNNYFSNKELLAPLQLVKRKFPFGPNSVTTLVDIIKQAYLDKNFFGTQVSFNRSVNKEGTIVVSLTIEEGARVSVAQARVIGLENITKKDFIKAYESSTALPTPFEIKSIDPKILSQIADLTKAVLVDKGYPDATVTWKIELLNEEKARPVFGIREGAQELVEQLEVLGYTLSETPSLPTSMSTVSRALDKAILALREIGHPKASYKIENVSKNHYRVLFAPGVLVHINGIKFEGASPTHEALIESKLKISAGDVWNTSVVSNEQRRILQLGLFSRVTTEPEDGELDSESETLVISVKEKSGKTLEVGTGANSEFGVHLFTEAVDRAFFDDGRTVSLRLDAYYDPSKSEISQGISELRYLTPNFQDSSWSLAEAVRYQRLDLSTYEFDLDRLALSSTLLSSKERGWVKSMSHTISREMLDNVSSGAIVGKYDTGAVRLGYLSGLVRYESLDEPVNPTKGYSATFDTKIAAPFLGSEASFASLGGRVVTVTPIARSKFGVAVTVGAQAAETFSDTNELPITQRYYLGGRTSVRGFKENSLGPRGEGKAVIGGDRQLYSSFELRYRMLDKVSLHTFFDAGNVFLKSMDEDFSLEKSVGVGMRYLSPIGPIGFDIGHPLNNPENQNSVRFHFTIGSGF